MLRVLSIVGMHFLGGHRGKGTIFLILLALLPFVSGVVSGLYIRSANSPNTLAAITIAVYLTLLSIVWFLSVYTTGGAPTTSNASPPTSARSRFWEALGGTAFAWILVGFGVISCVIGPLVSSDRFPNGITVFAWSSPKATPAILSGTQSFSAGTGDIVVVGRVTKKGAPLGDTDLRLLFSDYVSSPLLRTNDAGEFRLRMPEGKWKLQGPILPTMPDASFRFEVSGDIAQRSLLMEVRIGDPTRRVEMRIDVQ
jgi:hypothetical protein